MKMFGLIKVKDRQTEREQAMSRYNWREKRNKREEKEIRVQNTRIWEKKKKYIC